MGMEAYSPSGSFNDQMAAQHLQLGADTRTAVASELSKLGYTIKLDSSGTPDAVLSLDIQMAGYAIDPPIAGSGVHLSVLTDASLKDAKSGQTLFRQTFWYSASTGPGFWQTILADPKFDFEDSDALFAKPERAAEGLRNYPPAIAQAIALKLAKH